MRLFGLIVLAGLAGFIVYGRADPSVISLPPPFAFAPPATLTIVLVGDTGFPGGRTSWSESTTGIASQIDGDLNFANLETVVSDRDDLVAEPKLFNFRTPPGAVRHLVRTGFNLLSTANNHAMDYGRDGGRETMRNLDLLLGGGLVVHAGLGANRDGAAAAKLFDLKGRRIAFSAIGIATSETADDERPGQLAYQTDRDFTEVVARLAAAPAGYRILSLHHGNEFEAKTTGDDIERLRGRAVLGAGIDLVVGHHQHVVAGVELTRGKLIFYGLGNFLHYGTQDMSAFDICRDYGLVARVHLAEGADGRLSPRAVEAVAISHTHSRPAPLSPDAGRDRIYVLNHLAEALDDPAVGAMGVRFAPQPNGTGLYCAPGAERDAGDVGRLCAAAMPLQPPPESLRDRIAKACASYVTRPLVGNADPPADPDD